MLTGGYFYIGDNMSYGITPHDFVQQVYYMQEKVLLDFHPDDDKYKEVLVEANLVLQELQKEEDWTWLRERLILGPTDSHHGQIPEYELPPWVYKPSMLYGDGVRLHPRHHHHHHRHHHHSDCHCHEKFHETGYISVPWISRGATSERFRDRQMSPIGEVHATEHPLGAVLIGNTVTFNRPLTHWENHRIAVTDVQRRIKLLHVCNDDCPRDENGNCKLIEPRILEEIPDPNYVIVKTAEYHALGSPPAQGMITYLQDQAQKLLSAMREHDAAATDSDDIQWQIPGVIKVI